MDFPIMLENPFLFFLILKVQMHGREGNLQSVVNRKI